MFGWLRPKFPVSPDQKSWIDWRMGWLLDQFGDRRLREHPVVLPTAEFFPEPFDGSMEAAQTLFGRVCSYMDVDAGCLGLQFYSSRGEIAHGVHLRSSEPGTVGLYDEEAGRTTIWLEISQLEDPLLAVATLAHELGHVQLLGAGRIGVDAEDHEPLTDLLTVFFGMGIFSANTVLYHRNYHVGAYEGWSIGHQGYMTAPLYGYALARYAWLRREGKPAWSRFLRPDARAAFRAASWHLERADDSLHWRRDSVQSVPAAIADLVPASFRARGGEEEDDEAAEEPSEGEPSCEADFPKAADAYFARGLEHMAHGEVQEAIRMFSEAIRIDERDAESYQQRSLAYTAIGDFERALDDADLALELDPNDAESHRAHGMASLAAGDYRRAVEDFSRVIEEENETGAQIRLADAWYHRALALAAQADWPRAVKDVNRAIRRDPGRGEFYALRSRLYEQLGNNRRSAEDRQEARRLGWSEDGDLW